MIYIQSSFSTIQEYVFAILVLLIFYKAIMELVTVNKLTSRAKILDFKKVNYRDGRFEIKQNGWYTWVRV